MDTTKEERAGWRKEHHLSVGSTDLERLLNDADRFESMEGVVEHLKSMSEDDLTREDLMLMMANASKDVVDRGHIVAALEVENRKLKQQIYRLELEAKDRKPS